MAYKVFTNGSPLPASDLNTYLMNQSVMVFANSSARSSALTSPTEGMTTYLEDSNVVEVYDGASWVSVGGSTPITTQGDLIIGDASGDPSRLALGTSGQILQSNGTTATWSSPGSSWVSISSGSVTTGAATFSLTSLPAYDKYLFMFADVSSTTASALIRIRINGDTAGNYKFSGSELSMSSSYATNMLDVSADLAGSGGGFSIARLSSNAGSIASGSISISGGQSSGRKAISAVAAANAATGNSNRTNTIFGVWNNTAAITSIELNVSVGNIDGSGTYELWGSN